MIGMNGGSEAAAKDETKSGVEARSERELNDVGVVKNGRGFRCDTCQLEAPVLALRLGAQGGRVFATLLCFVNVPVGQGSTS